MTQEYTPVDWVDETAGQPGTLINKARLDQMQTAHHFADGFEEVDAVPTADPQVDYHKVVYCTTDSTFYRWDGIQWTKDIDDDTKQLLLDHEADHNNPHVVTKAQVGLGNVDNTSDADKPVSDAVQSALDDKLDDSQLVTSWGGTPSDSNIPSEKLVKDTIDGVAGDLATHEADTANPHSVTKAQVGLGNVDNKGTVSSWQGTPDNDHIPTEKLVKDSLDLKINTVALVSAWQVTPDDAHIPSEKLVKTYIDASLTDGSVTKVGTATVGGNLKPVYLNAGVPTAVANDLVDVASAQTIAGAKTLSNTVTFTTANLSFILQGTAPHGTIPTSNDYREFAYRMSGNNTNHGLITFITEATTGNGNIRIRIRDYAGANPADFNIFSGSDKYMTGPSRAYNASNTSDVVTIGSLQASTDVVHTTGNETINGQKTYTGDYFKKFTSFDPSVRPGSYVGLYPPQLRDMNNNDLARWRVDRGTNWSGLGWQLYSSNNQGTRKSVIFIIHVDHITGNCSLRLTDTVGTAHTLASWNDPDLIDGQQET